MDLGDESIKLNDITNEYVTHRPRESQCHTCKPGDISLGVGQHLVSRLSGFAQF